MLAYYYNVHAAMSLVLTAPIFGSAAWVDPPIGALTLIQRKVGRVSHSLAENEILYTDYDARCADVDYGNGNSVVMGSCHWQNNQRWFFEGDQLKSRHDNLCLDYKSADMDVYANACDGRESQKWSLHAKRIKSRAVEKCIDYKITEGNLYLGDCHTGANFTLGVKPGLLSTRYSPTNCVDHDYGSSNSNVRMHDCHSGSNEMWYMQGAYLKTLYDASKCLDWDYGGGDNVVMSPCHTGSNQKWYIENEQVKSGRT
eukprot:TRINITY_DN28408_c0_g1_i1.p1 TRINITY_DN28408_c0_g1~~TRINITY_DN28408_c0_g1_i1.p1  ORF type:complete len:256 (+),score=18.48 TRINITY_DN28408_c0_g1_i1:74-841(+)